MTETGLGRRADARNRSVRVRNIPSGTQEGLLHQLLVKHSLVKRTEIFSALNIFVPRAAGSRPRAAILSLSILAFTLDLSISHYLEIHWDSISLTEALPLFMCTVCFDKPLHLANAVPNPPHLLSPITVTHALTLFSCKKKRVLLIFR
jgi:hypothetical protein